ncbi:RpiB/LacA/LacB family sugar-phosphate isomerase [Candidatus Nomurabacteria bacterium]|nr:RpiB/LacA/LacB family sugar-phosphate isomerase [Candidatus Nomurabacteria bacterium]
MKIFIGTDHAGYEMKEELKKYLGDLGYELEDKGAYSFDAEDDYPDFIFPVAKSVTEEKGNFGIIIGGSGQGEGMCANRVKGARACEYYGGNTDIIKISREHNNANVLSLGARFISAEEAKQVVKIFLETNFSGEERHMRRIKKIDL